MTAKAWVFFRKDFQTQASYRLDFLMRISGMLMSMAIFYFISQILGNTVSGYMSQYGSDYFHFALLGIAFYPFVELSSGEMGRVVHQYQQSGTLEVLFLSPTPILATLQMSMLWSYAWAVAESTFYLGSAKLLFGARFEWANIASAAVVVLLAILANAGIGLINTAFIIVTKRFSPLTRLLNLLTNLLAGVYFPVAVLPDWLRAASRLLPATYFLDALRRTVLQSASLAAVGVDLLALTGFAAVLLPIGLLAFHIAVRWAKTDGSLSQY